MANKKVFAKILGEGEELKYSFSVSERYKRLGLVISGLISVPLVLFYGLGIVVFLMAFFYFSFYLKVANVYAFTNKRVLIYRGWLSTATVSIDYFKITDIKVREPFFERILARSGELHINTAGTSETEVSLRHIDSPYQVKKILDEIRDQGSV